MCCHAGEQPVEDWRQDEGQERDGDGCEDRPEDKGVPLPEPETASEFEGMFASSAKELVG